MNLNSFVVQSEGSSLHHSFIKCHCHLCSAFLPPISYLYAYLLIASRTMAFSMQHILSHCDLLMLVSAWIWVSVRGCAHRLSIDSDQPDERGPTVYVHSLPQHVINRRKLHLQVVNDVSDVVTKEMIFEFHRRCTAGGAPIPGAFLPGWLAIYTVALDVCMPAVWNCMPPFWCIEF